MQLVSSIAKESKKKKKMGAKKLNKDTFVNVGLNLIDKKIKKENSSISGSGITLRNNEIKDL